VGGYRVQVAKGGVVSLREPLHPEPGMRQSGILTLLDLDGALIPVPQALETDRLADRLAAQWRVQCADLEPMLKTLREVRGESAGR